MTIREKIRFWLLSSPIIGKYLIKKNIDKLLQYRFRNEGTIGEVIEANINQYGGFLRKEKSVLP